MDTAYSVQLGYARAQMVPHSPRITIRPEQMGGVPCVRGLRIPVTTVIGLVAQGLTTAQILEAYPELDAEDVRAALEFAGSMVQDSAPR